VGWRSGENLTTGSSHTFLGNRAGGNYTGGETNNICIGNGTLGFAGESNAIRIGDNTSGGGINVLNFSPALNRITIGNGMTSGGITVERGLLASNISIGQFLPSPGTTTFVGGILNTVPPAGSRAVVIGPNRQLADATASSRRFKKDIAPIDKISEGILALKPVTFHFKNDDSNYPQFGLIAEEVAEVNPDWMTRGPQGEIYGVRYDTIPILLLNEFLKEHRRVEALQASFAQQQKDFQATVAQQQKQIEALAAGLQKVSAQLEASKTGPQIVNNN
jgi:Chaperone of endosialidase